VNIALGLRFLNPLYDLTVNCLEGRLTDETASTLNRP
jgi:hypothetical protein